MDIKKVQEIVENSQLTDEAKDLIFKMLPEADKPEVKEEIMKVLDYEISMNEALADEGEEILRKIDAGEKMIDAAEGVADEQMEELSEEADKKFAALEEEKKKVEDEAGKLAAGEETTETAVEPVAEPTATAEAPAESAWQKQEETVKDETKSPWEQPAQQEPVPTQSVPQWEQPAAEPAQPVQQATEPTAQPAPQWDQLSQQPVQPVQQTQPAPFPGSQAGNL